MTREEYEQRKRWIEEQHRAAMELLEAAYRQQLRALELVWMTTADGELTMPRRAAEAPAVPAPQAAAPRPASPAPPPQPTRRAAWQLLEDVETALAGLPEVFDRNQLCDALGYEPDRGSLYRNLQGLVRDGVLALESRGSGKRPTRYRKTGASVPWEGA